MMQVGCGLAEVPTQTALLRACAACRDRLGAPGPAQSTPTPVHGNSPCNACYNPREKLLAQAHTHQLTPPRYPVTLE